MTKKKYIQAVTDFSFFLELNADPVQFPVEDAKEKLKFCQEQLGKEHNTTN